MVTTGRVADLGSVDELFEPDEGAGEVDEGEEAVSVLVEAGADAAEILELADEALDEVPLLVRRIVAVARDDAVLLGRDGRDGLHRALDMGDGRVGIVPPIGQDSLRFHPRQERDCLRIVARRPTGQPKRQWVAERVD